MLFGILLFSRARLKAQELSEDSSRAIGSRFGQHGIQDYGQQKFNSAIENLTKAFEYRPLYMWLRYRSYCYFQTRQWDLAIRDNRTLLHDGLDPVPYLTMIAECFDEKHLPDSALNNYKKIIYSDQNNVQAYTGIANCYSDMGKYDTVILCVNYALTLQKKPELYDLRASAYFHLKHYQEAIADYSQLLFKENTHIFTAYYDIARCYYLLKDFSSAGANFSKCIHIDSSSAEAFYWRGMCYKQQRNYTEAISSFKVAHRLDPDDSGPVEQINKCVAAHVYGDNPD
jgi:tetratricopeptide (TPR) repeat protein